MTLQLYIVLVYWFLGLSFQWAQPGLCMLSVAGSGTEHAYSRCYIMCQFMISLGSPTIQYYQDYPCHNIAWTRLIYSVYSSRKVIKGWSWGSVFFGHRSLLCQGFFQWYPTSAAQGAREDQRSVHLHRRAKRATWWNQSRPWKIRELLVGETSNSWPCLFVGIPPCIPVLF